MDLPVLPHDYFEYLPVFYYSSYLGVNLPVFTSFFQESPIQPYLYTRTGGTYLIINIDLKWYSSQLMYKYQ